MRRRMQRGLSLLLLAGALTLASCSPAPAQMLLTTEVMHGFAVGAREEPADLEGARYGFNLFTLDTTPVLIPLGRFKLLNGLRFTFLDLNYQDMPAGAGPQPGQELFSTRYRVLGVYPVGRDWLLMGDLLPGFATDAEEGLSEGSWFLMGGFLLRWDTPGAGTWLLGARYTTLLGEPLVLPSLGYSLRAGRWDLQFLLPHRSRVAFRLGRHVTIAAVQQLEGDDYQIDRSRYEDYRLGFSTLSLGLRVEWVVSRGVGIYLDGGLLTGWRRLEIHRSDERLWRSAPLENGPFVRLGFQLRAPRW